MSTQYGDSASGTEDASAELGRDAPFAWVANVANDVLPEQDVAGATATWTQRVFNLLWQGWRAFQEQRRRERLRVALCHRSERELQDIGVTSTEIEYIAAHRAIDKLRDRAMNPWMH